MYDGINRGVQWTRRHCWGVRDLSLSLTVSRVGGAVLFGCCTACLHQRIVDI